jgi:hypothetical protein
MTSNSQDISEEKKSEKNSLNIETVKFLMEKQIRPL